MAKSKSKPKGKGKAKPVKKPVPAPKKKKPKQPPKPKSKRKARAKPRAARQAAPRDEHADLLTAIDEMVSVAPGATVSTRKAPESRSRTPWMLLSSFRLPEGTTYDDVYVVLRTWRDDATIERLVRPQRLSRLQVRYVTDRGKEGEYTLAEIGPWELAVSRACERVGVRDDKDESLLERYGDGTDRQSAINALVVWFSSFTVEVLDGSGDSDSAKRGAVGGAVRPVHPARSARVDLEQKAPARRAAKKVPKKVSKKKR
jgi:hypothetical protein